MAKRRSETGKTGKHQHGEYDYSYDRGRTGRGRTMLIVLSIVVVAVVIIASYAFLFLGDADKPKEEEISLTTETPSQGGLPMDDVTFDYTVYNPDKEPDIFSPLVSGLPPDWNITIPTTISVEGSESKEGQFTMSAPYEAVNQSYPFKLEVTSANSQRTYALDYEVVIFNAFYGIEMITFNNSHDADPGNFTHYGLLITNLGNGDDTISLSYVENHLPDGWTVSFEYDTIDIPLFDARVVIVNITTSPYTSKGRYDIRVIAASSGGPSASLWLNTSLVKDFDNRTLGLDDLALVDYIGYFIDGVIFDTSIEEIALNENLTKEGQFSVKPDYAPLGMYVGPEDSNPGDEYRVVITGFWEGVLGMKANDTVLIRIPPEKAYDDGQWRIFEVTLISIDT
jgi:hypothetical protein